MVLGRDKIMGYQTPFILLAVAQAIIIIVLIWIIVRLNKKQKNFNRILSQYKMAVREDKLDMLLQNEYNRKDKAVQDVSNAPYEIEFHDEEYTEKLNAICTHLEYRGGICTKKYIINIIDELYLGHARTNGIVLNEQDIAKQHLKFIRKGKELYVQCLALDYTTVLVRGKTRYTFAEAPVKINDGDKLQFADSCLIVNLF